MDYQLLYEILILNFFKAVAFLLPAKWIENPSEQTIILMHADAEEDVKKLEELIRSRIPDLGGVETIFVGPVIGTHCGPGTVASCFMGIERKF